MGQINNPINKIKIDSCMFEEFSSPIRENPHTYMRISDNGEVEYKLPGEAAVELGGTFGSTITDWNNYTTYYQGQLVTYNHNIFRYKLKTFFEREEFDYNDWEIVAGYQKDSIIKVAEDEPITSITLNHTISSKDFIEVNVDNAVLQTNQYEVSEDGTKVIFREEIPVGSSVNIITYGNYTVLNSSKFCTKEFIATDGQTEFTLETEISVKDLAFVNIENTLILQSEWSMSKDHMTVILSNPVMEGDRVQVMYWENLPVEANVTFIPVVEKNGKEITISWTNDDGLENPEPVSLNDGATFTPHITKTDYKTEISWTNDAELENPSSVSIYDGINYVPKVEKDGLYTTLSWTNNQGAQNPESIVIEDGATFTPHTSKTDYEATISFTNDKGLENPEPITVYTNYSTRMVETFIATEGQTEFVASYEINNKSMLSINISNTEITSGAFELGEDGKTVTLLTTVEDGDIVELKYFYNLNVGTSGATYIPQTTSNEEGIELSWTNDKGLENPPSIIIPKGQKGDKGETGEQGIQGPRGDMGDSISIGGVWNKDYEYARATLVTYTDGTYAYGYISKGVVPSGTALTNQTYWSELYKVYSIDYIDRLVNGLQEQISALK